VWAMLLAVGLCALGVASFSLRRSFIATWFRDAAPGAAPSLPQPAAPTSGLPPANEVRVVLLDGLDRATAVQLPALSRFCASGLDLEVDVGFPTVSLPVQAVLWTGKSQAQTGLLYRVKGLATPLAEGAPMRVAGSQAVVEDQAFIAASFFRDVEAPRDFAAAAEEAVAGELPLVFVHVLAIDKAGHKAGPRAPSYRAAAVAADHLLARLLVRSAPGPQRRWLVLADHGHRPAGGHGGASAEVRIVRACLSGQAGQGRLHLVDLSRALHDTLGLAPLPGAVGRPLGFALARPAPGATLPRPRWGRLALAAVAFMVLLGALVRRMGPLGLWAPAALVSVVLIHGAPGLSNPAVYPPLGRDLLLAAAPGFVFLIACSLWRRSSDIAGLAALAPVLGLALAALWVSGGCAALVSSSADPPLEIWTTGAASTSLLLLGGGAWALAPVVLVNATRDYWRANR
jgi:hypothetical protein